MKIAFEKLIFSMENKWPKTNFCRSSYYKKNIIPPLTDLSPQTKNMKLLIYFFAKKSWKQNKTKKHTPRLRTLSMKCLFQIRPAPKRGFFFMNFWDEVIKFDIFPATNRISNFIFLQKILEFLAYWAIFFNVGGGRWKCQN